MADEPEIPTQTHAEKLIGERTPWAERKPKTLNAYEIVERNRELVAMWIRRPDLSAEAIGWRFGVTGRSVRTIYKEWSEHHKKLLQTEDPVDVMTEHVEGLKDIRAQAAELAARPQTADNVQLGCLKLALALRMQDIELRQRMGLLPDLETIAEQLDVRFATEQIAEVLKRHKVPEKEIRELAAVLKGEVTVHTIMAASHDDDEWLGDDDPEDD